MIPWATIYGTGVFRDPTTGTSFLLIATGEGVWATYAPTVPQTVPLPVGVTITGRVRFVQAFDRLFMFGGPDFEPLVLSNTTDGFETVSFVNSWDVTFDVSTSRITLEQHNFVFNDLVRFTGTTAPGGITFGQNYYVIDAPTPDTFRVSDTEGGSIVEFTTAGVDVRVTVVDGATSIPNAEDGVFGSNRLFLKVGDTVVASDIQDYTRYAPIQNEFRINEGGADKLVKIAFFGKTTLVCLKEASVYRLDNVFGDLSQVTFSTVTKRYGCVAPDTAIDIGKDFIWLSQEGVASLTLTEQNELQASAGVLSGDWPMFSDDIEPLIARINQSYWVNATARLWDKKVYIGVPLDEAETFRQELVQGQTEYFETTLQVTTLEVGAQYRYIRGAEDISLACGTDTLTTDGDFVAESTLATLTGNPEITATASLRRIYKGVNNAILVYDLRAGHQQQGAWSGHDEGEGIEAAHMFIYPINNRDRLFFANADGWIKMYEEGLEDQLSVPYTNVTVESLPAVGSTISVNGGNTITVALTSSGADLNWACPDLDNARVRLFYRNGAFRSYNPFSGTPWTAPNTQPFINGLNSGDVNFYSTNGVVPEVIFVGTGVLVAEVRRTPIVTTLETRGYSHATFDLQYFRWLTVRLQTWDPDYTIAVLTDGVEEFFTVNIDGTRDRTKWFKPWDRPDFDTDNDAGDFNDSHREDYSCIPGTAGILLGEGVPLERHQTSTETRHLPSLQGGSAQVKIVNSNGRIRVLMVRLETTDKHQPAGIHA